MRQHYRLPKLALALFILAASLVFNQSAQAQFDTQFWMPPVWDPQNGSTNDPSMLTLTTTFPSANVNVRTPDGTTFNQNYTVVAGTPTEINLSTVLGMSDVINTPELDKGLIITSDIPIQAVYRINALNNKAMVTLKGKAALGTSFRAGSQTYTRQATYFPQDKHFIAVMATEDNTTITVTTQQGFTFVGQATDPVSFTLNAGETYILRSNDNLTESIAGALIESDKQIVATTGAQHVRISGGSAGDAGIDQIVPIEDIGTEYIVVRGGVDAPYDYAMVTAAYDNTEIYIDGAGPVATINAGETYEYELTGNFGDGHYIRTSEPAYVYHVTGSGLKRDEVGMAIIPPINCTGSRYIQFTPFAGSENAVTITIPTNGLATLQFNGQPYTNYPTATTDVVPGLGGTYSTVTIDDADLTNNNIFTSDVQFHLGLLVGNNSSGTYGFLSGFTSGIDILDPVTLQPVEFYFADSIYQGQTTEHCMLMVSCDPNNRALDIVNSPNTGGTSIVPSPRDTCFNYTASTTYAGADTIMVRVENDQVLIDGGLFLKDSVQIGFYIFAPPIANPDTYTYNPCEYNAPYEVLINDSDPNPDIDTSLTSITQGPSNPINTAIVEAGTGNILFIADESFTGTETFIYEICDRSGLCDTALVTIDVLPGIINNAGLDDTLCANNPNAVLNGSFSIPNPGYWSGGGGAFLPDSSDLGATYVPSAAEIAAGQVDLILTSESSATGSVTVSIAVDDDAEQQATNTNTTSNDLDFNENGNTYTAIRFSNFNLPDGGILEEIFLTFSAKNTSTGVVNFNIYGHASDNSPAFTPAANDISNRTPTSTTVSWSPPDWDQGNRAQGPEQTTPDVSPIIQEIVSRPGWTDGNAVTLIFESSGPGTRVAWSSNNRSGQDSPEIEYTYFIPGCPETKDTVRLIYVPAPIVDAGEDTSVCANNATYTLDGSFGGSATGVTWSGGSGLFSDVNDINSTYTPTAGEISAGSVTLNIESIDDQNCIPVTDNMTINITPLPTVDAGAPISVCANNAVASLNGNITVATAAEWTTTGTGVFADSSILNTTYTPSAADITAGSVKLYLTTTAQGNCIPVMDSVIVTITPAPTVEAGPILTVCQNNPAASLNGSVGLPATGGTWTSAGGGVFTPSPDDLNATYTPSTAEISAGIAELFLETTTGIGNCLPVNDNLIIIVSDSQSVDAGGPIDVCGNNPIANLTPTTSAGITSVLWSGGAGSYNPANNVANTAYTATANEVSGGSMTLTITANKPGCNAVSDDILINFTTPPTAFAGDDQSVCANNPNVTLNGVVTIATGGTWQALGGSEGTYSPNRNTLNAVYTPSATEIANGSATLVLTTTGNGTCLAVTDTVEIEITPAPTVDPGTYGPVCANNATIALNGSFTVATGAQWSAGGGTFSPSNTNMTASYVPTAAEISAGVVNMTLTTTGNDNCNAVFGNTTISITPAPVPNPGTNNDVCEDDPEINLNGSVTVASGGIWTGGAGSFSPDNTTLNASYLPTPTEVSNGSVTLTLTTTNNGNCNAESANVTYTITTAPTVDAGSPQTVCGSASNVALNGTITVATGGVWATSGDGTFSPNFATVDAIYQPGSNDVLNGTVTLTLLTTGNGKCDAYDDNMTITFTAVPVADAGDPRTVCTNDFPIQLDGSGSQSLWSGGTGTFNPDNATLNALYTPSATEISNGSVTLTQTTVANGACNSVSDQVTFTILPGPIADAGNDATICASDPNFTLAGSISGTATGAQWTTSGTGTFDNATLTNATYTPSNADTAARSVFLILETTGTGVCSTMRDTMELAITPAVYAVPGNDRIVCANTGAIPLYGKTIISTTGQWSGGGGTYDVDDTDLTGTYTATAAEITAGTVTLTLTTTDNGSCAAHSDDVTFTIEPAPTVDIGNDLTICADSTGVPFTAAFTVATGVEWSTSGTGVFSPSTTNTSITYAPSNADTTAGSVYIKASSTGNGICLAEADSVLMTITPVPLVTAGGDQLLCADAGTVTLDGEVEFAGGVSWTTSGTGTFAPDNISEDVVYTLSSADSLGGAVTITITTTNNGTCQPVEDKAIITLSPAPTIEAGPDQIVCANDVQVDVIALTTVATGGTWTTSGTGTFDDPNALSTFYVPSAADTTAGSVRLFVESTGNGDCFPVVDSLTVTFNSVPEITAGVDTTICADYGTLGLGATFVNAGGMIWSTSGTGFFSPSSLNPNATYVISNADTAAGSVFLIATTTTNGPCEAAVDSLEMIINPAPYVFAGDDVTVCGDTAGVQLDGQIIVATGGIWTTSGTGSFSPDNTTLDAVYVPSAIDTAVGSVVLTLTSTGNGLCQPAVDQMTLTITPAPTVEAGNDITICADLPNISLDGTVTTATGGLWSTSGSGIFSPGNTTIDPVYTPSSGDKSADSVLLVLQTTGNGDCKTYYDTITLKITPIPTVDAGPNRVVCEDVSSIQLSGSYGNAGSGLWTTDGDGTFFPNNVDSLTSYRPAGSDSLVKIYYSANDIGTCRPVIDSMTIRLVPLPVVSAGNDIEACTDQSSFNLSGTVQNALGAGWISSGTGIFVPDSSGLSPTYEPSALDKTVGTVILTIESYGSSACPDDQDNLTINFTERPLSNAGPDRQICIKDDSLTLTGIQTNGSNGFWYAQDGYGYFNPNADGNTVVYYIDPSDTLQGSVTFEFWVEGLIPSCSDAIDEMTVTFNTAPVINAGGPIMAACADTSGFVLNGSGTSGTWSGGTGTFVPNNTTLNATYKPTLAEIGTGFVNLTLTSAASGACPPNVDGVQVNFQPVPDVDAGGDQTICADTSGIQFPATVDVATQVQWVSSGSGTFSPNSTTLQPTYIPSAKDKTDSTLTFTVITTDNGICDAATDRIRLYINPAPTVYAGLDEITCADRDSISLTGTVTNAGGIEWTTTGDGTFSPDEFSLSTRYMISSNDSTNGGVTIYATSTGNGFCRAVTDTMQLTLTPAVAVNAGLNDTICASGNTFQLAGSVVTAGGGKWTTSNGTGTFSPNQFALNAKYIASAADKALQDIVLTLTTTNNGTCFPVKDSIELNIAPVPLADAGANQTICANNPGAVLDGTFANAGGIIWETTGSGSFSPSATTEDPTYMQSAGDISAGAVILSLSTTGNGYCDTVTSYVNITIESAPLTSVNAGFDQTICADITDTDVIGTIAIAGGGVWLTTGTGSFADSTDLSTQYIFSANDLTQPFVDIVLQSTDNGLCFPVSDTSRIFIDPAPTADAGIVPIVCADISDVPLDATITVSTGGIWRSTGSGIFTPNNATVDATYIPSQADRNAGLVALAITSTGNGLCKPVTDFATLTMTPAPTANAGLDQTICEDKVSTALNGKITISGGGAWTSSGTGNFLPDNATLNASYEPSQADKDAEFVMLTLTTTNNGLCNAAFDRMSITITDAPIVEANTDQLSCANNPTIQLDGSVLNAPRAIWSGGNGTYTPSNATLDAVYTPTATEIANGTVTLTLTSNGNPLCNIYTDNMTLDIVASPVTQITSSDICAEIGADIEATGDVLHSDGRTDGLWSSKGTGTFAPAEDQQMIIYTPSQDDINNGRVTLVLTSDANATCNPVSDEIEVIIKKLPIADAGIDQTICRNDATTLSAATYPNIVYNWYQTDGITQVATGSTVNLSTSIDTTLVLTVTDIQNCSVSDTVTVFVIDPPTFNLQEVFCFEYEDTLIDANPIPDNVPGTYQWYKGRRSIFGADSTKLLAEETGTYIIAFNNDRCSVYDTTNITQPVLSNQASAIFCQEDDGSVLLDAGPGADYDWERFPNVNTRSVFATEPGTYRFSVYDAFGCYTTDSITVYEVCRPRVFVPSAIRPGGDPSDDKMEIFGIHYTNFTLTIYNRWGEVIYYTEDPENPWDGFYLDDLMPVGTYPYIMTYEGITDKYRGPYQEEGKVTIIK